LNMRVDSVHGRRIRKVHVLRQQSNVEVEEREEVETPSLSDREVG
jgi:hypothetical protein